MKKAVILFLSFLASFVVKSQDVSSEYLLLSYDEMQAFNRNPQVSSQFNVLSGVGKCYNATPASVDELTCIGETSVIELLDGKENLPDTVEVITFCIVKSSECCDYYPVKTFPGGEVTTVADHLLWPIQFSADTTKRKPYFLYKRIL